MLRAARHAALGDPVRLAIVDALSASDRAPSELAAMVGVASNLLAHHLDALEAVGLVERRRSTGDARRRYVHLQADALPDARAVLRRPVAAALFVCTANSARSPLAAALWTAITGAPASSAGTHPARQVHPEAVRAAKRAGVSLAGVEPRHLTAVPDGSGPSLVVTVCDQAHESLIPASSWLHWSVPDPAARPTPAEFDRVVAELRSRIELLAGAA